MRKKRILLLVIIVLELFAGCTDAMEVNDLAIVAGIGLDRTEDGQILVSILIPVTRSAAFGGLLGGSSPQKESTILLSEKGEGIMNAVRKIEKKLSRKIFFSQNEAVFIGERLAREGVAEVIDFLYRHPESHLRTYMFFTTGQAADILKIRSVLERSIIEKFVKEENLEVGFNVNLKDFLNAMTEEGVEPAAAQVTFKPIEVNRELVDKNKTTGIEGAAVLYKYKLVGWINSEEARGALWLRNELKTGIITINNNDEIDSGKISMKILKAKTKLIPILNGKDVEMEVKIYTEENIYENSSKLDLSNPEIIHFVEKKTSEDIKKKIQLALEKTQKELKSDIFGFGTALYREYPEQWNDYYKKQWNEIFPTVKVRVTCDVRISEVGLQGKKLISE